MVDFPGLGWVMTLSVAGALPVGCWFQGIRACLQNFNFSSWNPKVSPLGHTMRGGTCPQEEPLTRLYKGCVLSERSLTKWYTSSWILAPVLVPCCWSAGHKVLQSYQQSYGGERGLETGFVPFLRSSNRSGVSGITHPKTQLWLHLLKRKRAQSSVGWVNKVPYCSYNNFTAASGIIRLWCISFRSVRFYTKCLTH